MGINPIHIEMKLIVMHIFTEAARGKCALNSAKKKGHRKKGKTKHERIRIQK